MSKCWEWIDRAFYFWLLEIDTEQYGKMIAQFRMHTEYTRFRKQAFVLFQSAVIVFMNTSEMSPLTSFSKRFPLILKILLLCCIWVGQWGVYNEKWKCLFHHFVSVRMDSIIVVKFENFQKNVDIMLERLNISVFNCLLVYHSLATKSGSKIRDCLWCNKNACHSRVFSWG